MIKSAALKTFDVVTFRLKNCVFGAEQTNIRDEKLFQLSSYNTYSIEKGHLLAFFMSVKKK